MKNYCAIFKNLCCIGLKHRHVIWLLTKKELFEPYKGQIFGRFWTLGHPLFLLTLYTFIFNVAFPFRMDSSNNMPLDYTMYILSGLVPWMCFQQTLSKAGSSIVSNAQLVKQVVFPLEVLPLKTALASTFILFLGLTFIFIYSSLILKTVHMTYLLLPVVIVLHLMGMFGVSYGLSAIAVFIKDAKDFIQLFITISLFIMPIIYLPNSIPKIFKYVLYLNPFSYMVWVYQDVLFYGRVEHPVAWIIYIMLSLMGLVYNYALFCKLKPYFGNVV